MSKSYFLRLFRRYIMYFVRVGLQVILICNDVA